MSMQNSNNNHVSLNTLLKKTEHYDKDERYMAISDLCNLLLQKQQSTSTSSQQSLLDATTERRICSTILSLLDDSSNDVQAMAVKTLGVLLTTVQEEQAFAIADRLCTFMLQDDKSELRDVYAIGLRTLIKTIPSSMGDCISSCLIRRLDLSLFLNKSSGGKSSNEMLLACLDVLTDLLTRFGSYSAIQREHERILQHCLEMICSSTSVATTTNNKAILQKRASVVIGTLSKHMSDPLLVRCVETLLHKMEVGTEARAVIRTVCTVSHTVGHRLGKEITRIVPIFLSFCNAKDAICGDDVGHEGMHVDEDEDRMEDEGSSNEESMEEEEERIVAMNELRESCFAGLESFVLNCPEEVEPLLKDIVQSSVAYIRYDPNYSYGDDEEEEDVPEEDEDDDYSSIASSDFSDDDDDDSWKVRRGAVRCLSAVIQAMKHNPIHLWTDNYPYGPSKEKSVASALVDRFKEREENCRIDVIDCFNKLCHVTISAKDEGNLILDRDSTDDNVLDLHSYYIPVIIQACRKQLLAKKGERTKSSSLALLSTFCHIPNAIPDPTLIFTPMSTILQPKSTASKSLKLDALSTIKILLSNPPQQNSTEMQNALMPLLPHLCNAVNEDWYKVIAESLRVLSQIPQYYTGPDTTDADATDVAQSLYKAIQPRLAAHDLDQEIKECALTATSSLLSLLHAHLTQEQRETLLTLILERLKNETTRMSSMKTLVNIAPYLKQNLQPILIPTFMELGLLLRQQNRALKQSSLETLDVLIHCCHIIEDSTSTPMVYDDVLKEISAIIIDSDLHIAHLGLRTCISLLKTNTTSTSIGTSLSRHILPPALMLSTSSSLQESSTALESLLDLLKLLVETNTVEFLDLYQSLKSRSTGTTALNKHSLMNLAKCVAVITASTTAANQNNVIQSLLQTLEPTTSPSQQGKNNNDAQIHLALYLSGEYGRRIPYTQAQAMPFILIYLSNFNDTSSTVCEETKHASAYAFGRACVGSIDIFLPSIVNALESSQTTTEKKQYLLLLALKEFILCAGKAKLLSKENLPEIVPHLIRHAEDKEEGVRTMVAECLGSLMTLHPMEILPQLSELVQTHSSKMPNVNEDGEVVVTEEMKRDAFLNWTIAHSIKFAISGSGSSHASVKDKHYQELKTYMPTFLKLLKERDLSVRNAALLMVYSAVHHCPALVEGYFGEFILPSLYQLAQLNLKRVVDLGPFKHTVDDALPLRKSALSIFATSLENCPNYLDIPAFIPVLTKALMDDVEDVQLQAHSILMSMCVHHTSYVIASIDNFVEPLDKCIWKKKPGNKTGTELERMNEWIKSGLRVLLALSQVEGALNCRKLADLLERTKHSPKFQPMMEALEEEH